MKTKKEDIKVAALRSAARAIRAHNAELAAHLDRGVAIFTESPPISERLCLSVCVSILHKSRRLCRQNFVEVHSPLVDSRMNLV